MRISGRLWMLAGLAAMLSVASLGDASVARPRDGVRAAPRTSYSSLPGHRRRVARSTQAGGRYFIEFRSRYALSYGHTYAAFGRLNASGQIIESEVAGLHPAGESSVPWMMGHLIPVPSETGPSDGDLEEKYVSNRWRVTMSEAEYTKVVAKIREMQRTTPLWSAIAYNCNSFVGDIAKFMGFDNQTSTLQVPPDYISALKTLNHGQSSIAPGSI